LDDTRIATARECLSGADEGTMDFPTIVRTLMDAGFEGYTVDYRRATATYPGRRVLYFGRTAETRVEHFPR
jgi:hypothetical protein